jgi:flagellar biosynthesis protein FliQ
MTHEINTSFDFVVRERYILSYFIDRISSALAPVIMFCITILLLISIGSAALLVQKYMLYYVNNLIWPILCIFVLLWTMALLQSGDSILLNAMVDLRARFPCEWDIGWRGEYIRTRSDIDSIVLHCKDSPIGFRVFGIIITVDLLSGVTYMAAMALFSWISTIIATGGK